MTILNCSATTCMYNENMLCSRGEIEVRGEQARHSDETCCSSFRDGQNTSSSEPDRCGCEKISIDCKARECTYNERCSCTAAAIDIDGRGATAYQETKCGTFSCK